MHGLLLAAAYCRSSLEQSLESGGHAAAWWFICGSFIPNIAAAGVFAVQETWMATLALTLMSGEPLGAAGWRPSRGGE
jgi:hypothetical protein